MVNRFSLLLDPNYEETRIKIGSGGGSSPMEQRPPRGWKWILTGFKPFETIRESKRERETDTLDNNALSRLVLGETGKRIGLFWTYLFFSVVQAFFMGDINLRLLWFMSEWVSVCVEEDDDWLAGRQRLSTEARGRPTSRWKRSSDEDEY